jgi:hypothetical protein
MEYPEQGEAEEIEKRWRNREFTGEEFYIGEDAELKIDVPAELPPKAEN